MRTTPRQRSGLLGLACVAVAINAAAQLTDEDNEFVPYRVEVLVFRNLATVADNEDPGRPPLPPVSILESDQFLTADTDDPGTEVTDAFGEEEVPISTSGEIDEAAVEESKPLFFELSDILQLDEVATHIRRSRDFRLLMHESWSQPGFPAETSQAVDLLVLEQLRRLDALTGEEGRQGINEAPRPALESRLRNPELPSLSGTMTLYRSRYLHLNVDISFLTEEGARFEIHERRRMRSNELHYLDSPGLGVIALVIPIEDQQL